MDAAAWGSGKISMGQLAALEMLPFPFQVEQSWAAPESL